MDEINNPVLYSICKSAQINTVKAVNILAAVVLGLGLIGGLALIIIGIATNTEYYGYSPNWLLVGCGIGGAINFAVIWAILKMLVAIYFKLDKE